MAEIRLNLQKMSTVEVKKFLDENQIGLTVSEARKIQNEILEREPTITELIVWGIQGSEHSSYKSSKEYLKTLLTEGEEVVLGPSEDSGIMKFCEAGGRTYGLVLSHESHNHPSQVVPYEGAATGVGGIVRDVACMGAKVVGCADILRFGDIERNETKLIASGVIAGIAGYGNPLGVPNLTGDAFFHPSFNENCLVNVACVGVLDIKNILHSYVPENAKNEEYDLILVGKPTDRSGFGGASFASAVLDEKDKEQNKGAVQEPNPFLERHLLASFYDLFKILREQDLIDKVGFKDLGAGGVLCATIELAEHGGFGAEVFVENIHVGEDNLPAGVILCSETQERFCFAVPRTLTPMILDHFNQKWDLPQVSAGAKASVVGHITHNQMYKATHNGEEVCHAKCSDITAGLTVHRPVKEPTKKLKDLNLSIKENDYPNLLQELLQKENLCSKEAIYENYDQTVQGNSALERSRAEAGVVCPLRDELGLTDEDKKNAFAMGVAGNARIGEISPYAQGLYAVLTAVQKVACVGARTVALTDCLCYGSPEVPEEMWEFAEGIRGINAPSKAMNIPFISGNVSLYNRGMKGSVNPSCTIAAFGVMDNFENAVGNALSRSGNAIYLVGERHSNLGASELAAHFGQLGARVADVDLLQAKKEIDFMISANPLLKSAAVISEGGLLIALAKMALRGNIGFECDFSELSIEQMFSEFNGYVVEVEDGIAFEREALNNAVPVKMLGMVGGDKILDLEINELNNLWRNALRKKLG